MGSSFGRGLIASPGGGGGAVPAGGSRKSYFSKINPAEAFRCAAELEAQSHFYSKNANETPRGLEEAKRP